MLVVAGVVSTVAGGSGGGSTDGDASEARFDTPLGICVDHEGCCLFVADYGNNTVRKVLQPGARQLHWCAAAVLTCADRICR